MAVTALQLSILASVMLRCPVPVLTPKLFVPCSALVRAMAHRGSKPWCCRRDAFRRGWRRTGRVMPSFVTEWWRVCQTTEKGRPALREMVVEGLCLHAHLSPGAFPGYASISSPSIERCRVPTNDTSSSISTTATALRARERNSSVGRYGARAEASKRHSHGYGRV